MVGDSMTSRRARSASSASSSGHRDRALDPTDSPHRIADPMRSIGNRGMQSLLDAVSKREGATVSRSIDAPLMARYAEAMPKTRGTPIRDARTTREEREAADHADRILRMPDSTFEPSHSDPEKENDTSTSRASSPIATRAAPAFVRGAIERGGRPLDARTRAFFEPRIGCDLSGIRVHDDIVANDSAHRLNAKAYTIGRNIVFGAGRFSPDTPAGRRLLAHELTHATRHIETGIHREIDVNDFETEDFDEPTIQNYLHDIQFGKIENHNDSDDKARAVVKRWRKGTLDVNEMSPDVKATLIKEMQSGFTGDDDERAILVILLNSDDAELPIIFGPRGVDPKDLDGDFHGDEEDVLRAFFDRKFVGGSKAVLRGNASLRPPAPVPPPAPKIPWRELARNRVPYDQWPLEEKKAAERARKAANRRMFEDTPAKTTPEWWKTRDEDNELFRLQHPYREQMKDFFQRSTYLHLEASSNPAKRGGSVTFSAYVSVPSGMYAAAGQVEFVFVDREMLRIYGKDYGKKYRVFAPLVNGVARYTLTGVQVQHSLDVTAIYPDTGNLVGDESGLRLTIEP